MSNATERQTREQLIDKALAQAQWNVTDPNQVGLEIPVDGASPEAWRRLERELRALKEAGVPFTAELPRGVSDYVLKRPTGEIIAVVEAKRTSVDPRLAQAQTEFYVTEIAKRQSFPPFAFMTNGREIYFWDVGQANKRLVHGFFTPADLESQLYARQHKKSLLETPINQAITDRLYQQEAIRRVAQAFEVDKKRMALIVMATGTGKTRVAMSIIDLFMRSNQAQRVLFVADRDALVKQALEEGFKTHLPEEPCDRIVTHRIDKTKRLFAVTLQTLSNCFQQFSPAFFDLIIFDEVHRSIFNKWYEVIEYFDGRMIGLTATPAAFIDRNTFRIFQCDDEKPTFLYPYEQAAAEKYLVPYTPYAARTRFQRRGIKGVDLDEEARNALIDQGLDPDEIDYEGTELERTVSNKDTLIKQWQEFMDVCTKDQSGQLPGKTIVFAMTQQHALRLLDAFEEMYPQFPGLAAVITHKSEHKGTAVKKFKSEDMPRIAISVDMLDTGVNVPELVNLVFMKPVHSYIKLTQMIGRGTRNQAACKRLDWLPGGRKEDFLVIDFWENDLNKDPQLEREPQDVPVLVAIFNTRLKMLEATLPAQFTADYQQIVADIREQIAAIPLDSFSVKRVYHEIEAAWRDDFWEYLSPPKIAFLRLKVGPLLRYVPAVDVAAATFTSKIERLKWQRLTGKETAATIEAIRQDVSRLPDFTRQRPEQAEAIRRCLSPDIESAGPAELSRIGAALAGQMRHRRERANPFLQLDLPDFMETRSYIFFYDRGQPVYVDEYRRRVEEKILDVVANHPVIAQIERGQAVGDDQLLALERTLRQALGGDNIQLTEENIRRAYGVRVDSFTAFVRDLLSLDGVPDYTEVVGRKFQEFVGRNQFNADQIRFLRAVQSLFLEKRRLALADLYDAPPLRSFGADAVERFFSEAQRRELLEFTATLET
jgi:type I restriction enzyme, R subunit